MSKSVCAGLMINAEDAFEAGRKDRLMKFGTPAESVIYEHLERVLASKLFARSDRLSRFLRYSVQAALKGNANHLKEYVVGVEVFDRGADFDPRIDPVVRVEARRLRARLKRWHETEGRDATIVIEMPVGSYAVSFRPFDPADGALPAPEHGPRKMAVLPFANLNGEPELEYFSDGLTEELIHALTRVTDLHVVAWPSSAWLKGQQNDIAAARDRLGVQIILRGTVRRHHEHLRMTAQLIDASDGHYLWSEAWDRHATDLLAIEQEIAQAITDKLRVDSPAAVHVPEPARNPDAHTLYLKGRFHWNKRTAEGLRHAVHFFRQAIEKDSAWPLAWAGLADAYLMMATYSIAEPAPCMLAARQAAQKASELDPYSAEAVTCLAFVRAVHDWDWQGAGELYRRAISLNPSYATAHHWYGGDYLAVLGCFDEAIEEVDKAIQLDPLSSITMDSRALISTVAGLHEEAAQQYLDLLDHDPSFFRAWSALGRLHTQAGRYKEAVAFYEKARSLAGDTPKTLGALGQTLGLAGRTDEARVVLSKLHELSRTQYIGFATFAIVHLGLGERDIAFQLLERAIAQHEMSVTWLKVHPAWDHLRDESRFEILLRRIHLAA